MNGEVITTDLYNRLIVAPSSRGADHLVIVSGYLSAGFIETLRKGGIKNNVPGVIKGEKRLTAVFGMYPTEGVTKADHAAYISAMSAPGIEIQYYNPGKVHRPQVAHSKVYIWLKGGKPVEAYCGSMNATGIAFFSDLREAAVQCDPEAAWSYAEHIQTNSLPASEVIELIARRHREFLAETSQTVTSLDDLSFVDLPLYTTIKGKHVPEISGLNWGQRGRRNRNEAYIAVPSSVYKSGFFPPAGVQFIMYTDDGDQFVMARRQANGKSLHTVESNAIIGAWFRRRLGLPDGALVKLKHLEAYGRESVRVYRLPSDDYLLDFRPELGF